MDNDSNEKKNVVIIGAGRRGTAVLETLKDDPEVNLIGVVDINLSAPGMKLAKRLNILTDSDFVKFLKEHKNIDVVFNATGEIWVQEEIRKIRPDVEAVGGISIKLVWGIIQEREKALALQRDLYRSTIGIITSKMETESTFAMGHPEQVTAYATLIGQELKLAAQQMEILKCAAILHDIGKLNIPDSILLKPGRLTAQEYEQIKKHPIESENIVKSIEFLYAVLAAIRHHHERYDGKGYPDGLAGENIPLAARILGVADSFAAMTSDRPYGKAKTFPEAIKELERSAGTQFDPKITKVFIGILKKKFFKEEEMAKIASKKSEEK
jgi:HD-GYP domain-containing protein (c-di-GMP phosphodiesterase class II)